MLALDELLSQKLPQLHAHLKNTDCDISLIATDWQVPAYVCCLRRGPPHTHTQQTRGGTRARSGCGKCLFVPCVRARCCCRRYLCLYTTSLPSETVMRVFDGLFNEGPKVLFRVALALLKIQEETLLKCDNAGERVGCCCWRWWPVVQRCSSLGGKAGRTDGSAGGVLAARRRHRHHHAPGGVQHAPPRQAHARGVRRHRQPVHGHDRQVQGHQGA